MTRYLGTAAGWLNLSTGVVIAPINPPPSGADLTLSDQPLTLSGATLTMES